MRLIGLNGYKGSGKDLTFDLIKELAPEAQRRAFADRMKLFGASLLGLTYEDDILFTMNQLKSLGSVSSQIGGWTRAEVDGRQFLRNVGENARLMFGQYFWVDQVLPDPRRYSEWGFHEISLLQVDFLVVTDVRYEFEAERIKRLGGQIWNVTRPGVGSDGHISEQDPLTWQSLNQPDVWISNDGTLADLKEKLRIELDR